MALSIKLTFQHNRIKVAKKFSAILFFVTEQKHIEKNGTFKQLSINNQNYIDRQQNHSNKIGFVGNPEQQNQRTVISSDILRINNL